MLTLPNLKAINFYSTNIILIMKTNAMQAMFVFDNFCKSFKCFSLPATGEYRVHNYAFAWIFLINSHRVKILHMQCANYTCSILHTDMRQYVML